MLLVVQAVVVLLAGGYETSEPIGSASIEQPAATKQLAPKLKDQEIGVMLHTMKWKQ